MALPQVAGKSVFSLPLFLSTAGCYSIYYRQRAEPEHAHFVGDTTTLQYYRTTEREVCGGSRG